MDTIGYRSSLVFLLNARVPAGNSAASGAAELAGAASAGAASGRHLGVSLGSL